MLESENLPSFLIKPKEEEKEEISHINISLEKGLVAHKQIIINYLTKFPSGNFITGAKDTCLKIWNFEYKLIQEIQIAHDSFINYINVKDENTFASCSNDRHIKIWKKQFNFYINIIKLTNAHEDGITKVLFYKKNKLISASLDGKIKIWEFLNNNSNNSYINNIQYQCISVLSFSNSIKSILLLEERDIGISIGNCAKIFSLKTYEYLFSIEEIEIYGKNAVCKLDEDKIIVGGYFYNMKIFSLNKKKIIKEIDNGFRCLCICALNDKGVFLTGGLIPNVKIYRISDFKCIQILKGAHNHSIQGFQIFSNDILASYSYDGIVKFWKY